MTLDLYPIPEGDENDPVARAKHVRGRAEETSERVDQLVRAVDELTERIARHKRADRHGDDPYPSER